MPLGFKIADGYVEVHADYDGGELRRAARDAADDFGDEFGRESSQEATKSFNKDFQKNFADNFDKDGRITSVVAQKMVHNLVAEMQHEVDRQQAPIDRTGNRFAQRLANAIKRGLHNVNYIDTKLKRRWERNFAVGGDGAGSSFAKRFIEAVTLGMADLPGAKPRGAFAAKFAKLGTIAGVIMAGALAAKIGQAITALLPLALGGALLALPIASLIARNVDLEKGKLSFKKNDIGNALKDLIRTGQKLADTLGKVFTGPFLSGLKSATALMKQLVGPMSAAVKAITPGALAMWKGLLGAITAFGKAFKPALDGINAGLKQWGVEFPKIGKALGAMFSTILSNPELVQKSVTGFSNLVQWVLKAAGAIVLFLTYLAAAADSFNRLINIFEKSQSKFLGMPAWIQKIRDAFGPLGKAIKDVWEAFKKFATATTDKQVEERWTTLVDKIKVAWERLKTFLGEVFRLAWDKVKEVWNTYVVPWWNDTVKPALKEMGKAAMTELSDAAVAEFKLLPGKLAQALIWDVVLAPFQWLYDWLVGESLIPDLIDEIVRLFTTLPGRIVGAITSLPGVVAAKFTELKDKVIAKLTELKDKAVAKAKELVDKVVDWLKGLPGKAATALSTLASKVSQKVQDAATKAKDKAKQLVDGVVTFLKSLPGKAASAVSSLWSRMTGAFTTAVSNAKAKGQALLNGFIAAIKSLPSKAATIAGQVKTSIVNKFSGAASWLVSAGRNIINGLASGIRFAVSGAVTAAANAAKAALAAAKSAIGVSSPSKAFAEEVGVPAAQGIAMGLRKQFPDEMRDLRKSLPQLRLPEAAFAHAGAAGQANGAAFSPTVNLYMQPGFYSENAAAKRALTKDVFLALEAYRKDYERS